MSFHGIKLLNYKYKPLRMTYYSSIPFIYRNVHYKTLYHCIYANIFPSRHDELIRMTTFDIHQTELSLENFEVTESECMRMLCEMIMVKINSDNEFRELLLSTGSMNIFNNDDFDYYFGKRQNIYGKALMICRDKLVVDE